VVLANTVMSKKPNEDATYFPLKVDYEERMYAAGRIPGSRFLRREARPSEEAILVSRFIDRSIRPLFDQRMRYDIQVVVMTLSVDKKNDPDMAAMFGATLALAASDIPWGGPVGTVRVAKNGQGFIINPTYEERETADYELIVSGKENKINMIEGKSKGATERTMLDGIEHASREIGKLVEFQKHIVSEIGKEKQIPQIHKIPKELESLFTKTITPRVEEIFAEPRDKKIFYELVEDIRSEWEKGALTAFPDTPNDVISDMFESALDKTTHNTILQKRKRPDGRATDEIRTIYAEAGILPRTHGSGLFFRGDTHILSVATLGSPSDEQLIDTIGVKTSKRFMHHYNFPPFSVGEIKAMHGPGRREIGHGVLAEKALETVIPSKESFPYAIRIVSETLSSNGSSSMGSVCAGSLALMDAGIPISEPVAGVAMGLVMNTKGEHCVLTDIQGPEDHYGDMDCKIAGTRNHVTAMQMDVKIEGVAIEILEETFIQAKHARETILDDMLKALPAPRETLSPHAPRILKVVINVDKIGDVIGPGGKTINRIVEETGAKIDIEQDGTIYVFSEKKESAEKAAEKIRQLTREFSAGEVCEGKVTRIFQFGAMVEIGPNREGLVHISELAPYRVEKVTDIVNIGDAVTVKVIGIDELGRINLSIKALNSPANKNENRFHKDNKTHVAGSREKSRREFSK